MAQESRYCPTFPYKVIKLVREDTFDYFRISRSSMSFQGWVTSPSVRPAVYCILIRSLVLISRGPLISKCHTLVLCPCDGRAYANGSIRRASKKDAVDVVTIRSGLGVSLKDVKVFNQDREKG